jgi:type IV secretory pathway VirB10-like protein
MTGKGAQVTPLRAPSGRQPDPKKPILQPRTITVNPLALAGFGAAVLVAIGMLIYSQLGTPEEASRSMVDQARGGRVSDANGRMVTGLAEGEGSIGATLVDDVPAPQPVISVGPDTEVLQARISELETALVEASKEVPEVGALIDQLADAKGRIAELDVALRDAGRERERADIEFDRRLREALAAQASEHQTAVEQIATKHGESLAAVEGRLTELLDERAAASRTARIRSRSVLVNKGAPKAEAAFGPTVVPGDPSSSLGVGTTFRASLMDDVNSDGPGSITAMVVSDVRSASGQDVLIPEGSILRGRYRSDTGEGDGRVVISWNEAMLQPDGRNKRLSSGPRGENAFVTTLWPSDPESMKRDAKATVLVAFEIALAD